MSDSLDRLRIAVVSSRGGHLSQIQALSPFYNEHSVFFVVEEDAGALPAAMVGASKIRRGARGFSNVVQLLQLIGIFIRERPNLVLSCGAAPAVAAAIAAKVVRAKTVYLETVASVVKPSLTGRIMYHLADQFYYQWPRLAQFFPNGSYVGDVYGLCDYWKR